MLTAQNELENGVRLAEANGLKVDPVSGKVSLPRSLGAEGDPVAMLMAMSQAQRLINDAIEAATQADNLCTDALRAANDNAANPETTVEQAQEVQSENVRRALEEIRDTLPDGLSPSEVAAWWNGLTPKEQFDLQRAVPVELSDLEGIPESVKSQLTNDGRGYNPVETVRWAIDNAHNDGLDRLDNNCTLFASEALRAGGLDEKDGQWSKRDWLNPVPNIPGLNGKDLDGQRYTTSWYNADQQRDFFLNNGGSEVSLSQARPGDVVYFNWADPELHNGEVSHHTAVVTAVLPDGEVLYPAHPGRTELRLRKPAARQGARRGWGRRDDRSAEGDLVNASATRRLSELRNPRWWFVASGLLLGGALVPIYLGSRRIGDWVRDIEAADCLPPWPDAPVLGGIGWTAVYLAILAVLCLIIGLVLFLTSQRRIWVKAVVTLAGICVLLVALVVMAMGYTDASQQIDRYTVSGSDGGPLCPASG